MASFIARRRIRNPQNGFAVIEPGAVFDAECDGYMARRLIDGDIATVPVESTTPAPAKVGKVQEV